MKKKKKSLCVDETLKNMRIAIQRKELLGKRSFFLLESPMTQSSTYFTPGPDKKTVDFYDIQYWFLWTNVDLTNMNKNLIWSSQQHLFKWNLLYHPKSGTFLNRNHLAYCSQHCQSHSTTCPIIGQNQLINCIFET